MCKGYKKLLNKQLITVIILPTPFSRESTAVIMALSLALLHLLAFTGNEKIKIFLDTGYLLVVSYTSRLKKPVCFFSARAVV